MQTKTVNLYPGPKLVDPPFEMVNVAESDVPEYLAKGWVEAPPAPKGKKAKDGEKT